MTWLLIFAVLVIALVTGAVLPSRTGFGASSAGFPWFWIVFPVTVLLVALGLGAWLPGAGVTAGGGNFGWTMYMPLSDADEPSAWDDVRADYLSDDQAWRLLLFGAWGRVIYPLAALAGLALTVWAWRRRRI
jgi:heme/copper-type cytochrome/quinol oxidase subunit 1